jgi:hypothetical protein
MQRNVAQMDSNLQAYEASGGSVSVGEKAGIVIEHTDMWLNQAGGVGLYESNVATAQTGGTNRNNRASTIDCAGSAILRGCRLSTVSDVGEEAVLIPNNGVHWLVSRLSGRLALIDTYLTGSDAIQRPAALAIVGDKATALLRGCVGTNVTIGMGNTVTNLGIVGSVFRPSLNGSVRSINPSSPDGGCGRAIAGAGPVCDPRAECTQIASGGVECACVGEGLRPKPGERADGSVCQRSLSIAADLVTSVLYMVVQKPGRSTGRVKLHVSATGEENVNATILVDTAMKSNNGTLTGESKVISSAASNPKVESGFGSAIEWTGSVPSLKFNLDVTKQKYTDSAEHEFAVSLKCDAATITCPADGQKIEMALTLDSGRPELFAAVKIVTEVEAIPSCQLSTARVLVLGNGPFVDDSSLKVEVALLDVDGIPITLSVPNVLVSWDTATSSTSKTLLLTRQSLGSNIFVTNIPPELRSIEGSYTARVFLKDGWLGADANAAGEQADCDLLDQVFQVKPRVQDEGFNTGYIILGCAIGASILIGVLVLVGRKYRDRFEHVFTSVIVEVFKLTFAWAFEGGDIATDGISFHRTVVSNEIKAGFILPTRYKIAYIVIMCLASASAIVAFVYRGIHTRELFQAIRQQSETTSKRDTKKTDDLEVMKAKLEWDVAKTQRDVLGIAMHMLTLAFEGAVHTGCTCSLNRCCAFRDFNAASGTQ